MSRLGRALAPLILAASLALTSFSLPAVAPAVAGSYPVALQDHAPIFIGGDTDFAPANGVVSGSGLWYDPYVIEGWSINASSGYGVRIRNTSAYVILRGLRAVGCPVACIKLDSVSHAALQDSYLETSVAPDTLNEAVGLYAFNTSDVNVVSTVFEGRGFGLVLSCSSDVTVSAVDVLGDPAGSDFNGIFIDRSRSVAVISSAIGNHLAGIYAYESRGLNVSQDRIWSDVVGVVLFESEDVALFGNHFAWESPGIRAAQSRNLTIVANAFSFVGTYVIELNRTTGSIAYHNDVFNTIGAVSDNTGPLNAWDGGYPTGGNWWGVVFAADNCSGPAQDSCTGPDGIQDAPWPVTSNTSDRYPFANPIAHVDLAPVAELRPSFATGDTDTVFEMNASESTDLETPWGLTYRWDWDGDGVWDTDWSSDPIASHAFPVAGNYAVVLEVRDVSGQTDTASRRLVVVQAADRRAPTITHSPPTNVSVGDYISLNATVRDEGGVSNVTVYYALPGETTYHALRMVGLNLPGYNAIIPAPRTPGFLRYYIVAIDTAGNSGRLPATGTYTVAVSSAPAPPSPPALLLSSLAVGVAVVAGVAGYAIVRSRRLKRPPDNP